MTRNTKQQVYLVDDEPTVRKAVGKTLEQLGVDVEYFGRGADCLEALRSQRCDLLITDVKMPEMDGMELLREAKRMAPWMPVLMITGYGDVPMAVAAVKAGAADFIQKPLVKENFLTKVRSVLRQNASADSHCGKSLTRTEMRVLKLVVEGRNNKEIAELLGRSVRTVEDHRSNTMRKLAVHNSVELVKRVTEMGWFGRQ